MKSNYVVALLLSVGFLLGWYTLVMPRVAPPAPAPHATASSSKAIPAQTAAAPAQLNPAHPETAPLAKASPDSIFRDSRNDLVLASQGGAVRNWRLNLKGQEVDLVEFPDQTPLPLTSFPDVSFRIQQSKNSAIWTGLVAPGVELTKTLTLSEEGYLHHLEYRFRNTTGQPITLPAWDIGWGPGLGTAPNERKENASLTRTISLSQYGNMRVFKPGEYPEIGQWAGIDNRYFLVALIPPAGLQGKIVATGAKEQSRFTIQTSTTIPARATEVVSFQLYAGPKGYTQLKKYGKKLEEGVDFGYFSSIGKLILSALYSLQKWTNNYGWAIVLLTLIIQTLLIPLTLKSLRAQFAMKKLQPQMAALQAKYKNDPKRLNVEMLNLYKTSGTNPLGGCLPMLMQLPVFWALFTTLRNAYELRGAPFVGWIHDLSAADPWRVLPIVMGGAMFLQQRMTGAVTDPTQRQMMYIMPVVFTVMFMNFPAGLVLYWLTNSLFMLGLQYGYSRGLMKTGKGTPDSPQIVIR